MLDNLAAGATAESLRESYPALPPEATHAALACAAELARERVVTLPAT